MSWRWRAGWKLGFRVFQGAFQGRTKFLLSSALAMALGLMPLVVVFSIADGMIEGIMARTLEVAVYHLQVWPFSSLTPPSALELQNMRQRLDASYPGAHAWPERDGFALAFTEHARTGVDIRGVDPTWIKDPGVRRYLTAQKGTLNFPDAHSIWLGDEIAHKLGVQPGDQIKLLTSQMNNGTPTIPRITTLTVRALVSIGYQELDKLWVFVPYETAVQLLPGPQTPTYWGVKIPDPYHHLDQATQALGVAAGNNYIVAPWTQLAKSQLLNYQTTRALLALITALILLVASVNISTSMVTLVLERQGEIAILKATGTPPSIITWQFLSLGMLSGLLASVAGIVVGSALALNINNLISGIDDVVSFFQGNGKSFHLLNNNYYLTTIPVRLHTSVLLLMGFGTVLLATFAAWFPARRASRLRPLEVLRKV